MHIKLNVILFFFTFFIIFYCFSVNTRAVEIESTDSQVDSLKEMTGDSLDVTENVNADKTLQTEQSRETTLLSMKVEASFYQMDIQEVLTELSQQIEIPIIIDPSLEGMVNVEIRGNTLETALDLILSPIGCDFAYKNGYIIVGSNEMSGSTFSEIALTVSYFPKYIKADDVLALIPQTYKDYVRVSSIKGATNVGITAPRRLLKNILKSIESIDMQPGQVMIEALVTEFSEKNLKEIGIDWSIEGKNDKKSISGVTGSLIGKSDSLITLSSGDFLEFIYKRLNGSIGSGGNKLNYDLTGAIHALEERGKVKIHANPRLATIDGMEASIYIGSERYFSLLTGSVNYPQIKIEAIKAGIQLKITPRVADNGYITVKIEPEVSRVTGEGTGGLPVIDRRNALTTVRVKDGETIVIGGLTEQSDRTHSNGIPFLSAIPIIGYLFSSKEKDVVESEVVFFITPHIISKQ